MMERTANIHLLVTPPSLLAQKTGRILTMQLNGHVTVT